MIADLPRVQCLHTAVVADTAAQHLRTEAVDARCRRMVVAAEAALLRTEVEATHHRTAEVAVVDVLLAAEAAGMPLLRAAVGATAAAAGPKMVAAITATTKF